MSVKKTQNSLRIVLLGSGNVATHLGCALHAKGFQIIQVYSPNPSHARKLAGLTRSKAVSSLKAIDKTADLYILAVKDDAIPELAGKLKLGNQLVIHTSGSVPLDVLKPVSSQTGVFYPLQTFSRLRQSDWKEIPICLESEQENARKILKKLASSLSSKTLFIDSGQRRQLHLAAVFASNFSNHMYALAEEILADKGLPFGILGPLIRETAEKATELGPHEAQTGPARRNDQKTINSHLEMLKGDKHIRRIYALLTKSIQGK